MSTTPILGRLALLVFSTAVTCVCAGEKNAQVKQPGLLVKLGIEKNDRKTVTRIYDAVVDLKDLETGVGHFLFQTDHKCRARATELGKSPNSIGTLSGTWMEYSTILALKQRKKTPLYWQAEFEGLRDNFFDVVLFTKEYGPVVLSPKTSLRERYKQADLEAFALRSLFPKSRFYLLSLDSDKKHIANVQRKIAAGETHGLTALYDEANVDELFKTIEPLTVVEAEPKVLRSGRLIR